MVKIHLLQEYSNKDGKVFRLTCEEVPCNGNKK